MIEQDEVWRPGSFTKNFSWGKSSAGLAELHQIIRLGFDGAMENVPREIFRERVRHIGRPDYIPINFFLFNKIIDGVNFIIADELVFQALNWEHSSSFDKLALFVFNLSIVGSWRGAGPGQDRPALWSNAYIRERIATQLNWDTSHVNADDIEKFISNNKRYAGRTTRKLSTNLNYMFKRGRLNEFSSSRIEDWWVACLFLALDRIIEFQEIINDEITSGSCVSLLKKYHFIELSGGVSLEKELAAKHLSALYTACGGPERFSDEAVSRRRELLALEMENYLPNDPRPRGAMHPTNPRIIKTIPSACAMLARYAGFIDISSEDLLDFNLESFIKANTLAALKQLKEENIHSSISAEELLKLARDK